MNIIKKGMVHDKTSVRILTTYSIFFILFFGCTIISYFILPEALLKNSNPLQSWEVSKNIGIVILQFLSYNLLSVVIILIGNLFAKQEKGNNSYLPYGYLGFFTLIIINGVTLGTWSFSLAKESVPLLDRIIRTFDLLHRSGLWEISGQLFIVCATAKIAIVITHDKSIVTRKINTIRLTKGEVISLILGLLFMLIGALVESYGIVKL